MHRLLQLRLEQVGAREENQEGRAAKGIAVTPWEGNAPPRIAETHAGMLNAIGLQNVGLQGFLEDKVPYLTTLHDAGVRIVVNVIGKTLEEYHDVALGLRGVECIDALELNISCPNIKEGGIQFGTDCTSAGEATAATVEGADKPVWVKPRAPRDPTAWTHPCLLCTSGICS